MTTVVASEVGHEQIVRIDYSCLIRGRHKVCLSSVPPALDRPHVRSVAVELEVMLFELKFRSLLLRF